MPMPHYDSQRVLVYGMPDDTRLIAPDDVDPIYIWLNFGCSTKPLYALRVRPRRGGYIERRDAYE